MTGDSRRSGELLRRPVVMIVLLGLFGVVAGGVGALAAAKLTSGSSATSDRLSIGGLPGNEIPRSGPRQALPGQSEKEIDAAIERAVRESRSSSAPEPLNPAQASMQGTVMAAGRVKEDSVGFSFNKLSGTGARVERIGTRTWALWVPGWDARRGVITITPNPQAVIENQCTANYTNAPADSHASSVLVACSGETGFSWAVVK